MIYKVNDSWFLRNMIFSRIKYQAIYAQTQLENGKAFWILSIRESISPIERNLP